MPPPAILPDYAYTVSSNNAAGFSTVGILRLKGPSAPLISYRVAILFLSY
jgi:hypothetical protein